VLLTGRHRGGRC